MIMAVGAFNFEFSKANISVIIIFAMSLINSAIVLLWAFIQSFCHLIPKLWLGSVLIIKSYCMHFQCSTYNKVYVSAGKFAEKGAKNWYFIICNVLDFANFSCYMAKFISGFWDETYFTEEGACQIVPFHGWELLDEAAFTLLSAINHCIFLYFIHSTVVQEKVKRNVMRRLSFFVMNTCFGIWALVTNIGVSDLYSNVLDIYADVFILLVSRTNAGQVDKADATASKKRFRFDNLSRTDIKVEQPKNQVEPKSQLELGQSQISHIEPV